MDYEKYFDEILKLLYDLHSHHQANDIPISAKGEVFLLLTLAHRGGYALPGELAKDINVSTARIAAILKSIEKKGLIKREIDANDRRKILVTITPAGQSFADARKEDIFIFWKKFMDFIGEEDVLHSIRILKKVHSFVHTTDICPIKFNA
ncbi:MarR family winged helix-turn-helix transcriptional regulator [Cellulosilyticum ruminicola]|uniref:MarR family winged helix-turn-helix transcriptional regulator n=1 Tax=Cellulosilyticum ruminicola TaxID=425254 RepID=UPI0006CFC186|nr:MarR family transcriptional regulator [Cellulosilyticum ruminicola]